MIISGIRLISSAYIYENRLQKEKLTVLRGSLLYSLILDAKSLTFCTVLE